MTMQIILSGKRTDTDVEAPIGIYDVIRADVRRMSSVQPVNRVYIERTDLGYRGVLYSNEKPYVFALNGNGVLSKLIEDSPAVTAVCNRLEDEERDLTIKLEAERTDKQIEEFNEYMLNKYSERDLGDDVVALPRDDSDKTQRVWGPRNDEDPIERVPGAYRKEIQASFSQREGKSTEGVCGGGIVIRDGKMLLVKPRNGYGGYDWTFPKGYPTKGDEKYRERTAVREVREETGYQVFAKRFLGRFTHNDGGVCDYFICDVDNSKEVGKPDPFETAAVKWVTVVEALEMLNDDVDVRILAQANNLVPQLIIKGGHTGTMVALHLPLDVAKKIALPGGEEAKSMHITLAYLGKGLSEQQKKMAAHAVRKFAGTIIDGLKVTLGGVGRFSASTTTEGRDVVYLSVDSPALTRVRPYLVEELMEVGLKPSDTHGFVPHVTLAYIPKDADTPLKRFEPIDVKFDTISLTIADEQMSFPLKLSKENQVLYDAGRRNYEALKRFMEKHPVPRLPLKAKGSVEFVRLDKSDTTPVMVKALPRLSDEQREPKKVGVKPPGAAKKQAGATGKTRYTYPAEQQGGAKGGDDPQQPGQPQQGGEGAPGQQAQDVLPHPDTPPPQPEQMPIAAEHPEKPPQNDPRAPNPQQAAQPKHTLNVGELCAALNVSRDVLMQIVTRMQKNFGAEARQKFVSFMQTQMKEFAQEHGLEGDYFGLLYDVLTGKVPEGAPAAQQQQDVAPKPGS